MTEIKNAELVTRNILTAAQQFLHRHMFTLQMLPKLQDLIECRARSQQETSQPPSSDSKKDHFETKQTATERPIVANKEALQDKLNVLREQELQLKGFLQDALEGGRGDEAALLHRALTECKDEVAKLTALLQ